MAGLDVGQDFRRQGAFAGEGLPGAKRIAKKETVIKTSRVGIASNRRLRMNFNIDISVLYCFQRVAVDIKGRRLAGPACYATCFFTQ